MSKEQNGSHLKDTIIQLKDEQMKISAQVKWRLSMLNKLPSSHECPLFSEISNKEVCYVGLAKVSWVTSIFFQDEFARYIRLERKIKELNEELSQIGTLS